MTTYTRQDVREYMVDHFGLGRRGTNTGTLTTSITDADFAGPSAAEGIENGCEVLITSGTGAPHDENSRISSRPNYTTGLMTVDPAWTVAVAATDTFEILYKPFSFDGGPYSVHKAIDAALEWLAWEKLLVPVTRVPDGDMLKSATADWTQGGTATVAKAAAAYPFGIRSLQVTSPAADDYYRTGSIAVEEKTSYYLEVTGCISSSGDAADEGTLILYDVTNAANITLSQYTIDRLEPEILINNVSIPSGCEQVQIWLRGENLGDVIEWSNLIFRKNDAREFVVQDRPVRILELGRLLATTAQAWGTRGDRWVEVPAKCEQLGSGLWRYDTDQSLSGYSVWYEEFVEPAALTADTSTTTVPKEYLAAVASMFLLQPLQYDRRWAPWYKRAQDRAEKVRRDYEDIQTIRRSERVVTLAQVN